MTNFSVYSRESTPPATGNNPELDRIVAQLRISREDTHNIRRGGRIRKMPSRAVLATVVEQLVMALFPTHYGSLDLAEDGVDKYVAGVLGHALRALIQQVRLDLALAADDASDGDTTAAAEEIVREFGSASGDPCRARERPARRL